MKLSTDMNIVEFDSFETAFPVPPAERDMAARRFMTLLVESDSHIQVGGTSYVCRAHSAMGEVFALKRLLVGVGIPKNAVLSAEDAERIAQGHAAAFYEEYRSQMLVSRMRGFPRLYGYGLIEGEPAIVMEWVEGVSVRDISKRFAERGEQVPAHTVAAIGESVCEVLETLSRLDSTLVHRDISPTNIMVRTDGSSIDEQIENDMFDICLIDFGSAAPNTCERDASFTMAAQVLRRGTPEYAPPEMLADDIPHGDDLRKSQSIDVFALSSVLYELYAGHTPWRVADHPETTPYRLKMEGAPEALVARNREDSALVEAIMAGLEIDQAKRPSVEQQLARFSQIAALEKSGIDADEPDKMADSAAAPQGAGASTLRQRILRRRGFDPNAEPGLYTPDSAHFRAALVAEGGGRASEDISPFSEPSGLSRRSLIFGTAAIAVVAAVGGVFASRSCGVDSRYSIGDGLAAAEVYAGDPLYPARDCESNDWMLVGSSSAVDLETGGREPGRYVDGLIRVYDKTTGGYGFKTPVADESFVSSMAWAIARTFPDACDFSAALDGEGSGLPRLAAVKEPESGCWGYIGIDGEYVIDAAYASAGRFAYGFAPVQYADGQGLWGFVDSSGSKTLGPTFAGLGICSEDGLAAARDSESGLWGFTDLDGAWAVLPAYRTVRRFAEGLAGYYDSDQGLWGFIDEAGEAVIRPMFLDVRAFSNGFAPAQDAKTQLWGLVDAAGSWIAGPLWLSLGERTGDLFPAHGSPANVYDIEGADQAAWEEYENEGSDVRFYYGYIDERGNWIHKPQYGDTLIRASEQ